MPVSNNDLKTIATASTNGQSVFTYDFTCDNLAELAVYHYVTSTEVYTKLTHTTHYTVIAGTVTLEAAPAAAVVSGDQIVMQWEPVTSRSEDYVKSGSFTAAAINAELNRLTNDLLAIKRDLARKLDGGVMFDGAFEIALDVTAADLYGKYLLFDDTTDYKVTVGDGLNFFPNEADPPNPSGAKNGDIAMVGSGANKGQIYKRVSGAFVDQSVNILGPAGGTGSDGIPGGWQVDFSTTTTKADPGPGVVRLNNATAASVTEMYADDLDAFGNDLAAAINGFNSVTSATKGRIILTQNDDLSKRVEFLVGAATVDETGYRTIPLVYVAGSTLPDDGARCTLNASLKGDKGDAGAGGGDFDGPASSTTNALLRFADLTGDLGKNSTVVVDDSGNTSGFANLSMSGTFTIGGSVVKNVNNASLALSGATVTNGGANLWLYGSSHASKAFDMEFRTDTFLRFGYDHSAVRFTFHSDLAIEANLWLEENASPGTPAAGYGELFFDTSGVPKSIDDGGTVRDLTLTAIGIALGGEAESISVGTGTVTFRMPFAMTDVSVRATFVTAPTGSVAQFDVNENGVSILSTKLTVDAGEKTSTTAATPAVVSDSELADDAEITIDTDTIGATVAGAGAKIWIIGRPKL